MQKRSDIKDKTCPCCGAKFSLKYYLNQMFLKRRKNKTPMIACQFCGEDVLFVSPFFTIALAISLGIFFFVYAVDFTHLYVMSVIFMLGLALTFYLEIQRFRFTPLICYRHMQEPTPSKQMGFSQNPIIIFFVALGVLMMFGGIWFLWHCVKESNKIRDIYLFDYSNNMAVFNMGDVFYHTNANEKLISKKSFKKLGLKNGIGDIAFYKNSILVANGKEYKLYKCSLPLSTCKKLIDLPKGKKIEAIDIALTKDEKRLYLSYSSAGRIYYYDFDSGVFHRLYKRLKYPNDIMTKNGNLIVTDTNNHQILSLKHDKETATTLWKIKILQKTYNWPLGLSEDNRGRIWTIVKDGFFKHGKLIVFDNKAGKHKMLFEVDLGENSMPQAIKNANDFMLVSDTKNYGIYKVSLDGKRLEEFGDEDVLMQMFSLRKQKNMWDDRVELSYLLMIISGVILILCVIYEYVIQERKTIVLDKFYMYYNYKKPLEKTQIIPPDPEGIIWLIGAVSNTAVRQLFSTTLFFVVVYALMQFCNFDKEGLDLRMYTTYFMGALIFVLLILAIYFSSNNGEIGISKNTIYIKDKAGNIASDDIKNVKVSRGHIKVSNKSILFAKGIMPTFNQSQFNHYFLPTLKHAKPTNEIDIFLTKLKNTTI